MVIIMSMGTTHLSTWRMVQLIQKGNVCQMEPLLHENIISIFLW